MTDKKEDQSPPDFELTDDIITNLELGRVIRELEKLDDFLHQAKLRKDGSAEKLPKTTEALNGLVEANKLSLANETHRKHLIGKLQNLKLSGPNVHISFAVEPSPAVKQRIAAWMRENLDRHLILEVGLQPTISVGCIVRTTNKVFDMSLRSRFYNSRRLLPELLEQKP